MITVARALIVLKSIKALGVIGRLATINQIAKPIKSFSRATVYRIIPRMVQLGLVDCIRVKKKDGYAIMFYVTDAGDKFIDDCKELL